jgi:hypothetical protein
MKKYTVILFISLTSLFTVMPTKQGNAIVWMVVTEAIKKVLEAMDANIQRLQNKTIGLQNAQKALENQLSKLKLKEISDWAEKQRKLYQKYYDELAKVRDAISKFKKVKGIIERQSMLVREYRKAYGMFKNDDHFTAEEILYMGEVYAGILDESVKNLDQVYLAIKGMTTKMSDGERLEVIDHAAARIEVNISDLRLFNNQNMVLSVQRSKDQYEIERVKRMYGLP